MVIRVDIIGTSNSILSTGYVDGLKKIHRSTFAKTYLLVVVMLV